MHRQGDQRHHHGKRAVVVLSNVLCKQGCHAAEADDGHELTLSRLLWRLVIACVVDCTPRQKV